MVTTKPVKTSRSKVRDRSRNSVVLRGRVSGDLRDKVLANGDPVVEFRLIVKRDDSGFDTLDISAKRAPLRRLSQSLATNEWIEVAGVIRRRFWKGANGLASRWQVEAREMRKI